MPLYSLYALWFADSGLSDGEISLLFTIWSAVAFAAEVPSGALADRFSRRGSLIASGLVQGASYTTWIVEPSFTGFAVGFALLGFGTSLTSGAFEAWLYDGLAELDAVGEYQRVLGRVTAIALVAQLPGALAAGALFTAGGYSLVGWVSVGVCLVAAALATTFREPPRHFGADCEDGEQSDTGAESDEVAEPGGSAEPGYLTILAGGVREATRRPQVRLLLVAVVLLGGLDAIDEYFPLMAGAWHIDTAVVPLAIVVIPLLGAVGAAWGGRGDLLTGRALAWILGAGLALLGLAAALRMPAGLAAVAVFYGLHQFVLVAVDARLQHAMTGRARATVTSVASLGTELAAIGLYATWTLGGLGLIVAVWLVVAAFLPALLRSRR